jgi:hypothetical protein
MRGTGEAQLKQRTISERTLVPKQWVWRVFEPDDEPPPPVATGPPHEPKRTQYS